MHSPKTTRAATTGAAGTAAAVAHDAFLRITMAQGQPTPIISN